jgi:polyisoprenoid-binding protein YceI
MNKIVTFLFLVVLFASFTNKNSEFIARQGQITFFSYTSVENIEAKNDQVLSILDIEKQEVAISMLMRAFKFKKDLMYEHFNESYIESDIYPKATFKGKIIDFDPQQNSQIRFIKGKLTIHGITKDTSIKATISKEDNSYQIAGKFNVTVSDFEINIPPILSSNIAKNIAIDFNFQYQPYEN